MRPVEPIVTENHSIMDLHYISCHQRGATGRTAYKAQETPILLFYLRNMFVHPLSLLVCFETRHTKYNRSPAI